MLYIGVDLGTSAVKLLLMNTEGQIQKIVSKEYPIYFPHPGWSEQKPEDWFEQTMAGLKELLADCDKSQVAGISFGGQMHGLVVLDENDEVIRPALLWNDGRTTEECDYLNNVIGKDKLSEYTANISFTGFTAPKILWMKNKEPENFARIKKIMLPKDYINYILTGVHAGQRRCWTSAVSVKIRWQRYMSLMSVWDVYCLRLQRSLVSRRRQRSQPEPETMRQRQSVPVLSVTDSVIFHLERAEPYLYLLKNLA